MNNPLVPPASNLIGGPGSAGATEVVLSISAASEDHAALRRILRPISWDVLEAECCDSAFRLLCGTPVSAIIANDILPDGDWRGVLTYTQSLSQPPKLIVASRLAGESLWAEVLNLGGYDLLVKPFDATEVRRVVSLTSSPEVRRIEPAARTKAAAAAR